MKWDRRWVWRIVVGLAAAGLVVSWWFGPRIHEPNVCSLEYRDAYLKTHDTDAVLCRECPFEPWYRDRQGDKDCPVKPWYEP